MLCRMSNLTKKEIDEYWHKGLRAFEIYTLNDKPATYFGKEYKEGELSGWDTKIVLAKEEDLKYYPFFDAIIGNSYYVYCEYVFEKEEVNE